MMALLPSLNQNLVIAEDVRRALPVLMIAAGDCAGMRFLEVFAANICNPPPAVPTRGMWGAFWLGARPTGCQPIMAVQPLAETTKAKAVDVNVRL